ncbi:MAG: DUF4962 domain-containing protein [Limnochordia bacterium]
MLCELHKRKTVNLTTGDRLAEMHGAGMTRRLFLLLCLLILIAPVALADNLLSNPGFEQVYSNGHPPDWTIFAGGFEPGRGMSVETGKAYSGERALHFGIMNTPAAVGLRSKPIPAVPGAIYTASVKALTEIQGANVTLYLDFWDAGQKRIAHKFISTRRSNVWEDLQVVMQAPADAVWVSIILYRTAANHGVQRFDDASLTMVEVDPNADLFADEGTLDYAPADGAVVTTNPPSFIWIPTGGQGTSYTLEYSTDKDFAPEATVQVADIDISIYTPSSLLDAEKTWYWRVRAIDAQGNTLSTSSPRAFNIAANAVPLPLESLDVIRARIPQEHPRLFVTPETLPIWRERLNSDMTLKILWRDLSNKAIIASLNPLPNEPPSTRPNGIWDVNLYRQSNAVANAVANDLEVLAMAYLMEGRENIREAVRRLMLHVASWNPRGATSAADNDDASRPILISLARAYTWANAALSPLERQTVLNVLRIRGTEAFNILKSKPFESKPYNSHDGGTIPWMGEVALALMGEVPEAAEWFDYVVRIFFAVYPPWGGDPGGWAEGPRYWGASMNKAFDFLDALKQATGLDLYQKPFFRNTGTHRMMTQPPYSKMGPFGDFADEGPTPGTGEAMWHLAMVYQDPYYRWYADQRGTTITLGVTGFIRTNLYDIHSVRGTPPDNYPTGAYYPDVGWAVFHNRLTAPESERLQFMFKSSPYGSYSHSMADQNTFTLEAYGTPLAISSGYRPWYGSVHHMGWTKTTQAHNGVLVDGVGQPVQSMNAKGEIVNFVNGKSFGYTAGEAKAAYAPRLKQFTRHVLYIRPNLYVLFDDLKADQARSYSWLLHSYHAFDLTRPEERIFLNAGTATLDVRLWSSSALMFSQTDQFAVPLDEPMNKPVQWHLTATTREKQVEAYFLAVLTPDPKGKQREVNATLLTTAGGEGVLVQDADDKTVALFRRSTGTLSAEGLASDGQAAAWHQDGDGSQGMLLIDGTWWQSDNGVGLTASVTIDCEMTVNDKEAVGSIIYPAVPGTKPFTVSLRLPQQSVTAVTSSGQILDWRFADDTLTLELAPGEHQLTLNLQ